MLLTGGKGWDQQGTEATLLIRSRQRGYNPSPVQFITDWLPVPNSHKNNKNNIIIKKVEFQGQSNDGQVTMVRVNISLDRSITECYINSLSSSGRVKSSCL